MDASRVIIQIERGETAGKRLAMDDVRALLDGTGIKLDEGYGPILVNPKLGRYVVRGTATPQSRKKAEAVEGVKVFADSPQQPMQE